ncbi:hypothetical protein BJY01DRAFT_258197 [Aspergillus pseudoustus]|uniref:Uncharacterized protein n=1 Tax=Aspergillus pseudoustus TaxID=1810923 RepID=A0ABR4JDH6_9EURO
MFFIVGFWKILELLGCNSLQIFRAKLWWANLKLRLLPRWYYKEARDYIDWHYGKLRDAHAVLQRMRQLSHVHGAEVYIYNLHPNLHTRAASRNARLGEIYPDRDRQDDLRILHAKFRHILKELTLETDFAPRNAATWEYWKYCRGDSDSGSGRDRLWDERQPACATKGGCCGRYCGCCEQALYQYTTRYSGNQALGLTSRMVLRKMYGHCTAECACCVITHGVYEPDPYLPAPTFIARGRRDD